MSSETETTPAEEEKEEKRRMDPELRIMGQIMRILDELEEAARCRVVHYLSSRYPQ